MEERARRFLVLTPIGDDPEVGRWLAALEDYDVAPDWVLHHFLQHEAEHRSHICWLRDTFASRASD